MWPSNCLYTTSEWHEFPSWQQTILWWNCSNLWPTDASHRSTTARVHPAFICDLMAGPLDKSRPQVSSLQLTPVVASALQSTSTFAETSTMRWRRCNQAACCDERFTSVSTFRIDCTDLCCLRPAGALLIHHDRRWAAAKLGCRHSQASMRCPAQLRSCTAMQRITSKMLR